MISGPFFRNYQTWTDRIFNRNSRDSKKFGADYDDPKERYNKKDTSMYKDAFIGVRGRWTELI